MNGVHKDTRIGQGPSRSDAEDGLGARITESEVQTIDREAMQPEDRAVALSAGSEKPPVQFANPLVS